MDGRGRLAQSVTRSQVPRRRPAAASRGLVSRCAAPHHAAARACARAALRRRSSRASCFLLARQRLRRREGRAHPDDRRPRSRIRADAAANAAGMRIATVSLSGQRQVEPRGDFRRRRRHGSFLAAVPRRRRRARQARGDPVDRRSDRAQALSRPPADHRHGARGVRAVAAAGQGHGHRRRRHGARPRRSSRGSRRCRSWSGTAQPRRRATSSRCSTAIRRSATQVRASILVGERRWNLRLKNGIDVRLPETDIERALETLARLDREKNLLVPRHRRGRSAARRPRHRAALRRAAQAREDAMKKTHARRKGATRERSGARPCPQDEADLAQALGDRVRARHRHQQDRLR